MVRTCVQGMCVCSEGVVCVMSVLGVTSICSRSRCSKSRHKDGQVSAAVDYRIPEIIGGSAIRVQEPRLLCEAVPPPVLYSEPGSQSWGWKSSFM